METVETPGIEITPKMQKKPLSASRKIFMGTIAATIIFVAWGVAKVIF